MDKGGAREDAVRRKKCDWLSARRGNDVDGQQRVSDRRTGHSLESRAALLIWISFFNIKH